MLRLYFAMVLLTVSSLAHSEVIDTRSRAYQEGAFHLSQAQQALSRAIAELKKAEAAYEFPGLDLPAMLSNIQSVEHVASQILAPQQRRLEYKTIVPDGMYFTPVSRE